MSEIDIYNNISNRFLKNKITFTNVGSTLLIINPYKKDDDIYSHETIEKYINLHIKNPPEIREKCEEPHLYDLILIAIENFLKNGKNQSIIISGESGAGKTETAKNAMKCIIYYFQGRTEEIRRNSFLQFLNSSMNEPLEKKILRCNPILEAFGNGKTIRNDNSSRFGKYVTLNINYKNRKITGASIITYLLEKTRICQLAKDERNFHIFYQILFSGDDELLKKLHLENDISKYNYLNKSNCYKIDSINDANLFKETIESLKITGFNDEEIQIILKVTASVILLGNITFISQNDVTKIENLNIIKDICDMLNCKEEDLIKTLTINIKVIAGTEYENNLKIEDAISYRDTFAKEIYNKLFLWIVKKLNFFLDPEFLKKEEEKTGNSKYIGLLDIFGFECFENNSLEQLCINYTNEQLQHLYIKDFFESEIEEFKKEGLEDKIDLIKYKDNQSIIDLIDLPPNGIFSKLDDCSFQNKSDEYFVDLLKKELVKNKNITLPRIKRDFNIKIKHSAKEVNYNLTNFVIKNKDEIKNTMINVIMNSSNKIIKMIFFSAINEEELNEKINIINSGNLKKQSKFLSGKFKQEMQNLMNELKSCECHYIRCLKPNEQKKEFYITPLFLFNQIQYLGIFDTIKVRKDGYPRRMLYQDFIQEFQILNPNYGKSNENKQIIIKNIINDLIFNIEELISKNINPLFLFCINKFFMKKNFGILLENKKQEKLKEKIYAVNTIITSINYMNKINKIKRFHKNIKNIQLFFKVNKFRIDKIKKINKINSIQALYYTKIEKEKYLSIVEGYRDLQMFFKTFIKVKENKEKLFKLKCLSMRLNLYLSQLKEKKRKKINLIAKNLIKQSINRIMYIKYNELWQKLNPFFLVFLTRKKNANIVKIGKFIRENNSKIIVFDAFQMKLLFKKIERRKNSMLKIKNFSILNQSIRYFQKMNEKVIIIQSYIKRYIEKNKVFKKINKTFFKEDIEFKKINDEKTELNVFPTILEKTILKKLVKEEEKQDIDFFLKEINNEIKPILNTKLYNTKNKNRSMVNLTSKEILNSKNKTIENKEIINKILPEYDEYNLPKIRIFSRILSIDYIIDSSEIYEKNWGKQFNKVYQINMENNTPIQKIVLGSSHTILLNSNGKLFTWGWNNNNQCGINSQKNNNYILPNFKGLKNNNNQFCDLPVLKYQDIKVINKDYLGKIINCFSNEDYTYLLNNQGTVFSFGNNNYGQLGHGNFFFSNEPKIIQNLKNKIIDIQSTNKITFALTKDNEIYYWFHFKEIKSELTIPTLLNLNKIKIKQISCGYNFTMLLSKNGILYSMGSNEKGELGLSNDKNEINENPFIIEPQENIFLSNILKEKICNVKCGFKHTICMVNGGKIFGWGNNIFGQLGLGNLKNILIPTNIFIKNSKEKIIKIQCGFRNSIFFTENRNIYYCGILDKENKSRIPKKFIIENKSKEINNEYEFCPVKIYSSWNKNMSIFYASIADVRLIYNQINNIHKVWKILDILNKNWNNDYIICKNIESISNYFSSSFMKKNN